MGGRKNVTPIQQGQEASFRHTACDDKLDCITSTSTTANITMKAVQALSEVRYGPDQGNKSQTGQAWD